MGKKLKLRAWIPQTKTMFYQGDQYLVSFLRRANLMFNGESEHPKYGEPEFMEWTGLLDKNGKMVYDGDIMKYGSSLYVVKWDNQKALFAQFIPPRMTIAAYPFTDSDRCEVVGNIHENSEML